VSLSNKICLIQTCDSYSIACWDVDIDGSVLFKLLGFLLLSKDNILLYIDICGVGFVLGKYQLLLTFMF
jgi:hypothetical protein